MKRSHRHLYLAGLGLAAASLVADRVFLMPGDLGPSTASASASLPGGGAPPAGAGAPGSPGAAPSKGDPLAEARTVALAHKLAELAGTMGVDPTHAADAFAAPTPERPEPVASVEPASAAPTPQALAREFERKYTLRAVVRGATPETSFAVVDDRRLRVGETIDGFQLESVGQREASFTSGNVRAVLALSR